MVYIYLIGSGIIAVFWFIFYFFRIDLRNKILLTSLIGGVLGITEIFFVPNYWNPQFQVIKILDNLFLESLIFSFFLAGFSCSFYQVIFKESLFNAQKIKPKFLLIGPTVFSLHLIIPQINVMIFSFGGMCTGALTFYLSDKRLGKQILLNGVLTFTFFAVMYIVLWQLFPLLVNSYNYELLTGINILGIPIEELLFFFGVGTNFCLIYEILGNSRLKKYLNYFYA